MADVEAGTRTLDEAAMTALAGALAPVLAPPLCVYLEGDLGAGKTTFVRAVIHALGYPGRVKSPTYGLLEQYQLDTLAVVHLDLYRIGEPDELEFLGIADLHDSKTVLLVEWPERGGDRLPAPDLVLHFRHAGTERALSCEAYSSSGMVLCDSFNRFL